jgi:hypothetical protein
MPQAANSFDRCNLGMILAIVLSAMSYLYGGSLAKIFASAQTSPDGWVTVKDKTGSCQMSVPRDWKPQPQLPGHVVAPEHTETVLISGFKRPHRAMSESTQKAVIVDKLFENSPERWFYAAKPIPGTYGKPTLVVYHVDVARDDGECIAQILVNQNHSEDEVKRIAASVSAVKPEEKQDKQQE